ncbi:arginine synthesis PII-interacting regulator PirA [Egbenema bharatensis]|uniref:arginine synthesis PII-interacting regulator PirA n=1 Tax=Egbenema bharatensis TaxID=3463334 RepID=UPI003A84AB72
MNRNRQQMITQAVQMHRDNLRKNVQRRLEVARLSGNDALIRQLESEASYIG